MIIIDAFLEVLAVIIALLLILNFIGLALYLPYFIGMGLVNLVRFFMKKPPYEIEEYVGF